MANLIIKRNNERINKWRKYRIFIDGNETFSINNGETKNIELPSGEHTVEAKIDWCASPVITIRTSDEVDTNLQIGGIKYLQYIVPPFFILFLIRLLTKNEIVEIILGIISIPLILMYVYYLTIGRKKYLNLTEILP